MARDRLLDPTLVRENMRSLSLPDRVYQILRDSILSGQIHSGVWLRQRDLAEEMGVGTATVRQALCRLADEGLVLNQTHKGFRTTILGVDEMVDRNGIQSALTGLAVEVAAQRILRQDLLRMRGLLPATLETETDWATAHRAHDEFHWIAFRASGRAHLLRLLETYWDTSRWQLTMRLNTPDEIREWARICRTYNTQILEALEAGDGRRAREAFEHFWEDDLRLVLRLADRIRPEAQEIPSEQSAPA